MQGNDKGMETQNSCRHGGSASGGVVVIICGSATGRTSCLVDAAIPIPAAAWMQKLTTGVAYSPKGP
jgi:hypothetical protein